MRFSSLLGHCVQLLDIIESSPRPADSLMDSFFRSRKYLGSHDRKFIAETIYGTLRHRTRCTTLLKDGLDGQLYANLAAPDVRLWTVVAYLVGTDQQKEIDAAALAERSTSALLKEQAGTILSRLKSQTLTLPSHATSRFAVEYSFPEWIIDRFLDLFGEEETKQLCSSLNTPAPMTLRVNMLKGSVEDCELALKSEGVETSRAAFSPSGLHLRKRIPVFQLKAFRDGLFEVQDEGSQLVPYLIDPKPTSKVLDACAGAGGKSLQLAALMKNRGEVFASDINGVRLLNLKKRSKRAGAFNIRVSGTEELRQRSEEYRQFFDIVLVDAPCSGLGTIRRNPGLKWTVTEEGVGELSEKQYSLLREYAPFVKPGGRMYYVTCTMLKEENEVIVQRFLHDHGDFFLADARPKAKALGLEEAFKDGYFRLLPHRHGTDAFFCAVLERTREGG